MARFFSKIRKSLIVKSKFGQYIVYAIGEIVLVVIGILIAIWINNYNASIKSNDRFEQLLLQVRKELETNLNISHPIIDYYSHKDSLITMIMLNKVSETMYQTDPSIRNIILNFESFTPKTSAFERLMANSIDIPPHYDSLIDKLKNIYIDDLEFVKSDNLRIADEVNGFLQELKLNKPWFSEWIHSEKINEDATKMMISDPIYRNYVASYWQFGLANHYISIKNFRSNAYQAYQEITKEFTLNDAIANQFMNILDFKDCVGLYVHHTDTIRITAVKNKLQMQRNSKPVEGILPYSRFGFSGVTSRGFNKFIFENNNIQGLHTRFGFEDVIYTKQ